MLIYDDKRLMTLHWVAGMMEAIRAHSLLLTWQRVFGTSALPIQSVPQKPRHRFLSILKSRTTCIGVYSSAARACL